MTLKLFIPVKRDEINFEEALTVSLSQKIILVSSNLIKNEPNFKGQIKKHSRRWNAPLEYFSSKYKSYISRFKSLFVNFQITNDKCLYDWSNQ